MRKIYRDAEFKCHVSDDGTRKSVETDFFDSKCDEFVEGFRYVNFGEHWTSEDGTVFYGRMISAWKPYSELAAAQAQYERDMAEAAAAYQEGVNSAYEQQ